jgi:GTP-binding protein
VVPVIALIGRPNVGKSTLFNRLTQTKDALVADLPGLTRDRQYGFASFKEQVLIVVDTGGLAAADSVLDHASEAQSRQAIEEADAVVFLVDGRDGLTTADRQVASGLRGINKPIVVAVNKSEGVDAPLVTAEFFELGLGEPLAISALRGQRIDVLLGDLLEGFDLEPVHPGTVGAKGEMEVAIIGRPNAGKSTLVNRLLGEDRVLTSDQPGTTRDSVRVHLNRGGEDYWLVDTAGLRRRARIDNDIEHWSVAQTLTAIDRCSVVVALIDSQVGVTDQDLHLIGLALQRGRPVAIGVNKWDGLSNDERRQIKSELDRLLDFAKFVKVICLSALHGSRIDDLMAAARRAHDSGQRDLPTADVNRILEGAVQAHPPPLARGRRIRLRYAHQGGRRPPRIVIHGNQTAQLPDHYRRYLANTFRQAFKLEGAPLALEFKQGDNPFAGRRNELTPRQRRHRERLIRHDKKKKRR